MGTAFKFRYFGLTLMLAAMLSCNKDGDAQQFATTQVSGQVKDITRNLNLENIEVKLIRLTFGGGGWGGYGVSEITPIDSTLTDVNGNYLIAFDFNTDPEFQYLLTFEETNSATGPYADLLEDSTYLVPGEDNIRNYDYWYASILKLDLDVTNNFNPPLGVSNKVMGDNSYHFIHEEINAPEISKFVYLPTKPGAEVQIQFYYNTGNSNADAHKRYEFITTPVQDTISLSFEVDCSVF